MAGDKEMPKPPPLTPKPSIRNAPPVPFPNETPPPPPLICTRPVMNHSSSDSIIEHEVPCKKKFCLCKLDTNLNDIKTKKEGRKTRSDKGQKRGPQLNPRGGGPRGGDGGGGPTGGGGQGIST